MTQKEYIEKMIALDTTFELALKDNLTAAAEIKKEMGNLLSIASDELNLGDFLDVAFADKYLGKDGRQVKGVPME